MSGFAASVLLILIGPVVETQSGEVLYGTILAQTDDSLRLGLPNGAQRVLPLSDVTEIHSGVRARVETRDGSGTVVGFVQSLNGQDLVLKTQFIDELALNLADLRSTPVTVDRRLFLRNGWQIEGQANARTSRTLTLLTDWGVLTVWIAVIREERLVTPQESAVELGWSSIIPGEDYRFVLLNGEVIQGTVTARTDSRVSVRVNNRERQVLKVDVDNFQSMSDPEPESSDFIEDHVDSEPIAAEPRPSGPAERVLGMPNFGVGFGTSMLITLQTGSILAPLEGMVKVSFDFGFTVIGGLTLLPLITAVDTSIFLGGVLGAFYEFHDVLSVGILASLMGSDAGLLLFLPGTVRLRLGEGGIGGSFLYLSAGYSQIQFLGATTDEFALQLGFQWFFEL